MLERGRNQADAVLNVTGRDIDEGEYALTFHSASGSWQLFDEPASDHTRHEFLPWGRTRWRPIGKWMVRCFSLSSP